MKKLQGEQKKWVEKAILQGENLDRVALALAGIARMRFPRWAWLPSWLRWGPFLRPESDASLRAACNAVFDLRRPRRNGGIECDHDDGPCARGAWHHGSAP